MVKVGFNYPFVIRGLLSISALHLATLEPESSAENLVIASTQYNTALLDFRTALRDVDEDSCIAVFGFSCVTVVHALGVAQVQKPDDPIAELQNCMHLVRGIRVVLEPHLEILTRAGVLSGDKDDLSNVHASIPEVLELRVLAESIPDRNTSETCVHAIDLLHKIIYHVFTSHEADPHLSFLLTWPLLLTEEFFEILSLRQPVAILIITYFAAGLGYKGRIWWLEKWCTYIMEVVKAELMPDMLKWLEWPKRIMVSSPPLFGEVSG
jgi:hypothetical protein